MFLQFNLSVEWDLYKEVSLGELKGCLFWKKKKKGTTYFSNCSLEFMTS